MLDNELKINYISKDYGIALKQPIIVQVRSANTGYRYLAFWNYDCGFGNTVEDACKDLISNAVSAYKLLKKCVFTGDDFNDDILIRTKYIRYEQFFEDLE